MNAFARSSLVDAGGKIETHYTSGVYTMEMSSAVYKSWRFDMEGLPNDLLKRYIYAQMLNKMAFNPKFAIESCMQTIT